MKKQLFRFIILFPLLTTVKVSAQDSTDSRVFTAAQMQQDFNYLRKALEDTHPGLYMHHTKEAMQYKMDSLYSLLDKPMPFFDFYKMMAYLIAEVKCEHTYCNPYGGGYNKRLLQWKLIPLQLYFTNNKAYVAVNRTADTSIHLGDEVLTIDHYPVDSIKQVIYKYMTADGNMESSKERAISTMAFNLYYYLFIERPDAFDITFKNAAGEIFSRHFDSDLDLAGNNKIAVANPANAAILALDKKEKKLRNDPWRFELVKEKNAAILFLNTFEGDREKLFKFYDKFFTKLQKEKIDNLIVYLYANGGGEEEYGCELLNYFIDKPTRFIESEYLVTMDTSYLKKSNLPGDIQANIHDFIDTIKDGRVYAKGGTKYSMELQTFEPKQNRFTGKVYFYVGGVTSSAASTCAANAQSMHLATIVGDETAGCYVGGGTTNGLDLVLPNSKIIAHTSIVYTKFATTGGDKDRGVIPDHYFIPDFFDLVNNRKGWKGFIYGLMERGR